jgi:hypothetical protein
MCLFRSLVMLSCIYVTQTFIAPCPHTWCSTYSTHVTFGTIDNSHVMINDQQIFIITHGEIISRSCWAPFVVETRIEHWQYLSACDSNALPTKLSCPSFPISCKGAIYLWKQLTLAWACNCDCTVHYKCSSHRLSCLGTYTTHLKLGNILKNKHCRNFTLIS